MLKTFTILFIMLFSNLSADIVQKLEVNGNKRVSTETIKVYGEINIGNNYSAFDLDKILKNLYKTDFFEEINLSLTNNVLNITVKEYPIINSIRIEGEKSNTVKKKVLEKLQLQERESFIENKLSQDMSMFKKIYASIGYNFVSVEPKIEKFDDDRVNLIYVIEKGQKTDISKIDFIGDKKVKEKRLRDIIVSEEKKFWKFLSKNTFLNNSNIELDKRLLINYYKSIGYYDVQILSNNAVISQKNLSKVGQKNSTTLTYTINAGNRYRINKISTNVSEVLDKKLFIPLQDSFKKVIGKYYSPFSIKKLLDELDNLIADNDLQFIEHSVNEILEGDEIEVKINIFEIKEKQYVEKINILGNTVTNETVIRAELLLDEGDPFNKLKLDQSMAKLKSKNIFGEIKNKITDGANKGQKIIEIEIEEKPTGEISAGAGIGTNGGSFAFNVTENNWLGKGINVVTSLDVGSEVLTGALKVTDPNFNFSGNSINYFLSSTSNKKDTSGFENKIITTGIGTSFEQYKDIYVSPSISLALDNLKVSSTASDSLKRQKGSFTDLSFNYGIAADKRNRVYDPTEGYISSFNQAIPIYADSPYIKNSYAFSKYKTISPDAIGAFKFFASAINGLNDKDVRLSKRIFLPNNRLRGFEAGKIGPKDGLDFVGGNYAMASNFEVKLPNLLPESTKTDVGLFLDLGNIWEIDYDKALDNSNKIRSTAGINTSWLSPLGPMSFIFSQNLSKANTDITESFNFRLGTSF